MQILITLMSLMTFALWGVDKYRARTNQWRIPERQLLAMTVLGGGFGALAGMFIFRHKTRKPLFLTVAFAASVIQVVLLTLT